MPTNLCKYKDVFGKEREGVHSIRVFDIAIVDLGLTVLAALIISKYFGWNAWAVIAVLLIIGVLAHRAFCVNTRVNTWIFGVV